MYLFIPKAGQKDPKRPKCTFSLPLAWPCALICLIFRHGNTKRHYPDHGHARRYHVLSHGQGILCPEKELAEGRKGIDRAGVCRHKGIFAKDGGRIGRCGRTVPAPAGNAAGGKRISRLGARSVAAAERGMRGGGIAGEVDAFLICRANPLSWL